MASAREILAAQATLVQRLQAAGRDATQELLLLAEFKRTLAMFENELRRVEQEETAPESDVIPGRWPE